MQSHKMAAKLPFLSGITVYCAKNDFNLEIIKFNLESNKFFHIFALVI